MGGLRLKSGRRPYIPPVLTEEEMAEKAQIDDRLSKIPAFNGVVVNNKDRMLETHCPVCGKFMIISHGITNYAYKRTVFFNRQNGKYKQRSVLLCSYSCMRKMDKYYGSDSKTYGDTRKEAKW